MKPSMEKTIRQTVTFRASPHDVYEALMDSTKHAAFTGGLAKISRTAGGRFSVFGGDISGKNIKVLVDKTIIQSWRIKGWPRGHTSTVTFSLAKTKDGTRLTLTHVGVPREDADSVSKGWKDYYWIPMKNMLERRA